MWIRENFIFYFPESLTKTALRCQEIAGQGIPRLKDIIGKYYYPADMNGRKVPIYLMADQKSFNELMTNFCSGRDDFSTTAGITISEISPSGYYLSAIALNGRFAFSSEDYTRNVLWHELTHYCFFASIDYNQLVELPMWCYEGIAEYTSLPGERPSFSDNEIRKMRSDCDFGAGKFHDVFENYRGGQSIFCHMEDLYRVEGVKCFLKTLYGKGIPASFRDNFSTTVPAFEADWKANLDKFKR